VPFDAVFLLSLVKDVSLWQNVPLLSQEKETITQFIGYVVQM
jgi:hypothetical protein